MQRATNTNPVIVELDSRAHKKTLENFDLPWYAVRYGVVQYVQYVQIVQYVQYVQIVRWSMYVWIVQYVHT